MDAERCTNLPVPIFCVLALVSISSFNINCLLVSTGSQSGNNDDGDKNDPNNWTITISQVLGGIVALLIFCLPTAQSASVPEVSLSYFIQNILSTGEVCFVNEVMGLYCC